MSGSYNDSTEEQRLHGMSIDTQITALQEYCKEHGYEVYNIYNDAGFSARKSYKSRPGLLKMIEDCEKFNIILFTRLDRFCRSVKDYYSILAKLDNTPWKAIWEDYETETPDGTFKVNIMLSVAQSEADKTSARLKDSYQYRKAKGIYYGRVPLGYILEDGKLIKDPNTKEGVQAFFDCYLETLSSVKAMMVAKDYGILMDRSNQPNILKNPVYTGITKNGHRCEPYITPEQHDFICSVKKSRKVKNTHSDRVYIFSGVLVCGYCGRRLAGKARTRILKDGKKTYQKYICQGYCSTRRYCSGALEVSETKIEDILLSRLNNEIGNQRYEATLSQRDIADKLKARKKLEGKLDRVKEMYIEGDISKDVYTDKKLQIERDLSLIRIEKQKIPELPKEWKKIYNDLTPEYRQLFWKKTIDRVILTNENKKNPTIIFRS